MVGPSFEYGNETWDCNKRQADALESVILVFGSTMGKISFGLFF